MICAERSSLDVIALRCHGFDAGRCHDGKCNRNRVFRPRHHREGFEMVMLAIPGDLFLREKGFEHLKTLLKLRLGGIESHPHAVCFVFESPFPHTQNQSAVAKRLGLNHFAGKDTHIMQRQLTDRSRDFDFFGMGSDLDRKLQR